MATMAMAANKKKSCYDYRSSSPGMTQPINPLTGNPRGSGLGDDRGSPLGESSMSGAEMVVNSGWDKVGKMAAETHHHSSTRDLFRENEKAEKHTLRKKQNREMQKVGWVIDPRKSSPPSLLFLNMGSYARILESFRLRMDLL